MANKMLLSISADSKTVKGEKLGFLTGILYLAPNDIADGKHNLCPFARKAGCDKACLYSAGRGAFSNVQAARVAKTLRFLNDRENFLDDLFYSICKLQDKAQAQGLTPLVRLNGTSDIQWEKIPVNGRPNIMAWFPEVQFYDYTKIPTRSDIPANYDLTFSYSHVDGFRDTVTKAKNNPNLHRWAVVFAGELPDKFMGYDVINGDDTDVRHLDDYGVVVGLKAKGQAKKDTTGFVVR